MFLRSVDIKPNGSIPALQTCDGANVSPHLEWDDAPEGTKSFAISCFDPGAPAGPFAHWLVHDIPSGTCEIAQGGRTGGIELRNDFGGRGYAGPCPPKGTHTYIFTLYALSVEMLSRPTRENFVAHVEEVALAKAELMGKYRRK
jgi:Raf kinase inhibitor-like YbhB/YbcL family protein